MGKTADLTVVQKTIIDTLNKEGKPQTFIGKEATAPVSHCVPQGSVLGPLLFIYRCISIN